MPNLDYTTRQNGQVQRTATAQDKFARKAMCLAHQEHSVAMASSNAGPEFERGPLVTIAIPTFNRASWLGDCVLSALSQTYPHFEVLISDNASTDKTQEVLKEFSDPRVRVVKQKTNIGLIPNWNACLAAAKGDYVVFVSDDDRIAPWMLERCVALIIRDPQIPIVITLCDVCLAAHGRTRPGQASSRLRTGIWNGTDILIEYLKDQMDIAMTSIMLQTAPLRAIGGFPVDLPHAGDVAAWAPLLLMGKAGLINESCATYNVHSDTESIKLGIEQLIRDGWKVADLISDHANRSIVELAERRRIKLHARRCFARRGALILSRFREGGGTLAEVLRTIWRFRRNFRHIGVSIFGLTWPIAIIILPESTIAGIRRLKRTGQLRRIQNG
jgi:glycosyltransferase involved in cell wall biosynthesis